MKHLMSFVQSLGQTLAEGLIYVLQELWAIVLYMFQKEEVRTPAYDAKFATDSKNISKKNGGFSVSGTHFLTEAASTKSMLIVSPSGGGKSTVSIIPSALQAATFFHGMVVHDVSGELHAQTSGYLKKQSYTIQRLLFNAPDLSDGFNPLKRATTTAEINKICSKIVAASMGSNAKDPFWSLAATNCMSIFCQLLQYHPEQYRHLSNVRFLINIFSTSPQMTDKLFAHTRNQPLIAEYASLVTMAPNTRTSVLATCKAALSLWADDNVCRTTCVDTLDFNTFRSKTAVFIQNPALDSRYYQPLISIFFEQVFNHFLEAEAPKTNHHLYMILDEVSTLNLPTLGKWLELSRKRKCGSLLALQDLQQLQAAYKDEHSTITANCSTHLFIGPSDATAEMLEKRLGQCEFEDEKGRTKVRPLMTRQQLKTLGSTKGILFQPSEDPLLLDLKPCYQSHFASALKIPPVTREPLLPTTVPMITTKYIENFNG